MRGGWIMKSWVLAASLLAAAAMPTTVRAADLDEGPPPDRYGAYEDPRYADIYGHPQPPPAYLPPPRYAPPVPPGYAQHDYGDDYDRGDNRRPNTYAPPVPPGYAQRDYGDDYDRGDNRRPNAYAPPVPPGYAQRDRGEDYDRDDYRRPYAYATPPAYGRACTPHEAIKERLLRGGWSHFRDAEQRGEFAIIIAMRPDGQPFALTLDRCSGEVVNARPLGGQGHFAYGPPRNWDRSY
jgi:hypothetical protein